MNATPSINGDSVRTTWRPRSASADEFTLEQGEDGGQVISYTVRRGDTLSRISRALRNHFGIRISYQTIASQNSIADPDLILVGQQLRITVDRASPRPAAPRAEVPATPEETDDCNDAAPEYGYYDGANQVCDQDYYNFENEALECVDPSLAALAEARALAARPPIVNGVMAEPSLINQSEVRASLLTEADVAIRAGNDTLALEIADLFIQNCADEPGLRAGANLYLRAADRLFEAGSYSRASVIYRRLATRFSGRSTTLDIYPSGQVNLTRTSATIRARARGERSLSVGSGFVHAMSIRISRAAVARAEQCDFLTRSGIEDPFDLEQVRNYILGLSNDRAASELGNYFSAFYFHTRSDISDSTRASAVATFPINSFGQRPADCRLYALMAREIFTPGLGTRIGNFFRRQRAPYSFEDVYTFRVAWGVRRRDSGHQMLLIQGTNGGFLLNNDQVIPIEDTGQAGIQRALANLLEGMGYQRSDQNRLPMTNFIVIPEGEELTPNHYDSAPRIFGNS